jgi:predicted nucleic acid-binding protein
VILIDTNVVSALRRPGRADPSLVRWAKTTLVAQLYLSVVSLMELEVGVLLVERRDAAQGAVLRAWLENQLLPQFASRILPVDEAVARRCAALHVPDRRSDRDALIAATAIVRGMAVATRNTADFAPTGVSLINPWESPE